MPSGLIALLDDVATIAKLAAASVDDVGLAVGKAGTKAAGVVIDDTAVTPRYVTGLAPERELPIIGKIAWGSLKNKLLILLPVALLLSAFAPFLITPLLMIGGAYLAFEATEKILEAILRDHHPEEELIEALPDPVELEKRQVAGAIRTDFILSAEIMAIALAELEANGIWMQAAALAAVGVVITAAVYGVVGADREARRHRTAPSREAAQAPARSATAWSMACRTCSRRCRSSARRQCCGSAAALCCMVWRSCTSSKRCRTSYTIRRMRWQAAAAH